MFFRFLEPLARPIWAIRARITNARMMKGKFKHDVQRAKRIKGKAGQQIGKAKQMGQKAQGAAASTHGRMQNVPGRGGQGAAGHPAAQGAAAGQPHMQGQPAMQPGQPGAPRAGIRKVGFFRKKHVCNVCNTELDKTWEACPYCAEAKVAPADNRTQAFMIDAAAGGRSVQMLGWIVPLKGPHRGELYSLAPMSTVGTEPTCTVVLADPYMSSIHAEIRAEGGVWMLHDKGSTNGTFVNDKRVDTHELVDNDFVKFGNSLVKFKSL